MELGELVNSLNGLRPTTSMDFIGKVELYLYPEKVRTVDRVNGITPTIGVMSFKGTMSILRTGDDSYYLSSTMGDTKFQLAVGIKGEWFKDDEGYIRATVNSFSQVELDRQFEIRLYNS